MLPARPTAARESRQAGEPSRRWQSGTATSCVVCGSPRCDLLSVCQAEPERCGSCGAIGRCWLDSICTISMQDEMPRLIVRPPLPAPFLTSATIPPGALFADDRAECAHLDAAFALQEGEARVVRVGHVLVAVGMERL